MGLSRLVLTTLVAACAMGDGECWFWDKKKPPVEEPMSNNEMLLKALRNIINDLISTIKLTVTMRLVEMLVILAILITLLIIIRWFIKGRPGWNQNNSKRTDEENTNGAINNLTTKQ